jgi:hypothetical protein
MANHRKPSAGKSLRQYQALWLQIAKADAATPISVRCSSSFVPTVLQAVKKEKTIANMARKNLDLPRYGKLSYTLEPAGGNFTKITFHLAYNGDFL